MERETVVMVVDFALGSFRAIAVDSTNELVKTLFRYADFARNDPSFDRLLDLVFDDDEVQKLVAPEIQQLRARADKPQDLTAEEFITTWLPIILKIGKAIREARQKKKAAGAPAAA